MPAFKKIFRRMFSRKQDFPGVVISHPPEEWIDSKARDFALIEELERRAGIREFLRRRGFVKREYRVKLLGLYPDLDWHGDFGKWKDMFGVSMVIPLLATHARDLGASSTLVGILGSLYGFIQLFSSPIVGRWSDRTGRKKVLIICLVLSGIGYCFLGIATTLFTVFLARIPLGIFKHSQSICKSYVGDKVSPDKLTAVQGRLNSTSSIGFIIGPVVGGYLAEMNNGFYAVSGLSGLIFIINAVIAFQYLKDARSSPHTNIPRTESSASMKKIVSDELNFSPKECVQSFNSQMLKDVWDLFLIKFLLGLSAILFRSNFSLLLREQFLSTPKMIGFVISYGATVSAICGFSAGKLIQFYKKESRLMLHMSVIQCISLFITGVAPTITVFVFSYTFLCSASSILRVVATSLTVARSDSSQIGTLMGFSQSVMSIARMLSPLFAGIALDMHKSAPAFIGAFTSLVAVSLMVLWPQDPKLGEKKSQ